MGIIYDPLWKTMDNRGMTKYKLIHYYDISPRLITKLQRNEPVTTTTIEKLCCILQCDVADIVTYFEDEYNVRVRNEGIQKINDRKNRRKKA